MVPAWTEFIRNRPDIINGIMFDAGLPSNWATDQETELVFECCDEPNLSLLKQIYAMWSGYRRRVWSGKIQRVGEDFDRLVITVGLKGIPDKHTWNDVGEKILETAQYVRITYN